MRKQFKDIEKGDLVNIKIDYVDVIKIIGVSKKFLLKPLLVKGIVEKGKIKYLILMYFKENNWIKIPVLIPFDECVLFPTFGGTVIKNQDTDIIPNEILSVLGSSVLTGEVTVMSETNRETYAVSSYLVDVVEKGGKNVNTNE